jgi:hypothetical protein
MHDAPACAHPVDGARLDQLLGAQAVAMHHRALEKVGHRGEADVRVWAARRDSRPGSSVTGPKWSKKTNGPTLRCCRAAADAES